MAFVFTVEDGTGVTGSNSYISVSAADDYFVLDPNFSATWMGYETTTKEYYLAWSTRILDQKVRWRGYKEDVLNSLRWPRVGVYDADNEAIGSTEIPRQLKQATCEFAKWLVTNDPTVGKDVDNLKRLMVDVIEIEYQDDAAQTNYPSIINQILHPLGVMQVGGAGFGRIIRA